MANADVRSTRWPPVGYESLPWEPQVSRATSRSARRRHRGPYRAAVVPGIASRDLILPSEVAALVEDAAAEIARFDAEMGHEIAPFAAVLLRSESAASSKIENLTASARAIAQAELSGFASTNARLIVANVASMNAAVALSERIDAGAILAMHRALLGRTDPEIAGAWREQPVWIGGSDYGPHDAAFVPPHHRHIQAAIDDLIAFIDRDDVPVLAHTAIAHAQFETIHPFPDGNGRVGRALLHAHLRNKALVRHVTIPLSAGLLVDTDGYFAALTHYREGDPVPIVDRLAHASFAALENGGRLVGELRQARRSWEDRIRARRGARAWAVADLVIHHPVVNAQFLADQLGIPPGNVYRSLEPLVTAGVLVEFTDKKRNRMWQAPEILEALDGFATRSGRRRRTGG